MANPQLENGHTRIANELLEAIIKIKFGSDSPLRMLLLVYRKCYGYQKKADTISITQFEKLANLSRPTVDHWLKVLVKHLLLVKGSKPSRNGYTYTINKNYDDWKPLVKPLELVKGRPFTSKTPLTSTSKTPLTHKRKKESITKEREKTPTQIFRDFISNTAKQQEVAEKIAESSGYDINDISSEIQKFIAYWTEPSKSGKKQKWELQQTFELKRRLTTWLNNKKKYEK